MRFRLLISLLLLAGALRAQQVGGLLKKKVRADNLLPKREDEDSITNSIASPSDVVLKTNMPADSVPALKAAKADSILDSLNTQSIDNVLSSKQEKLDSVRQSLQGRSDSLLNNWISVNSLLAPKQKKLDSLQRSFYTRSDSLKNSVKAKLSVLESSQRKIRSKVDSLQNLKLPTEKYTAKLDSIRQQGEATVASLNKKMEDLKSKTTGRIKELDLPPDLQSKASGITKNIEGFRLPSKDLNVPSLNIPSLNTPGNPLSSLDGLNATTSSPIGEIGNVPGGEAGAVPGVGALPGGDIGGISNITEQAGAYTQDLKNITSGNLGDVQKIPDALEGKAADMAGVGDLPASGNLTHKLTEGTTDAALIKGGLNQDALKDQVQQQAVNHFAGKEKQLQEAMDKMSKLKSKYSSLNSLSEIPKRRPNEMRGKPFIERLIPGVALQVQKRRDDLLVDFNPYAGYRFTGRITGGLGWNHRVGYNIDDFYFTQRQRIFGPRVFGEYKLGDSFYPRIEFEVMNTNVPPLTRSIPADFRHREWVSGAFMGIKKNYRFLKHVKGTTMIMLRLYNPHHSSPYGDVINVRFGFEFPLKKKVRKVEEQREAMKAIENKISDPKSDNIDLPQQKIPGPAKIKGSKRKKGMP